MRSPERETRCALLLSHHILKTESGPNAIIVNHLATEREPATGALNVSNVLIHIILQSQENRTIKGSLCQL